MDAATAGLLGALLGGGLTVVKTAVDVWSQRKLERAKAVWGRDLERAKADWGRLLERAKADWGRENAVASELRSHIAEVARQLLSIQHSMEWLSSATDSGGELTPGVMTNYHVEIHGAIPKLLGALASVASLDEPAYKRLSILADAVFALDSRLAEVLRGYLNSPFDTSQAVANLRSPITKLYKQLPEQIAAVMKSAR